MNRLPRKAHRVRRSLFYCLITLSIVFSVIAFWPSVEAQTGWRVTLEEGKTTRASLTLHNRCPNEQSFSVESDIKYLKFEGQTDSILIPPGGKIPLWATFDSTGLKSRIYEDKLTVHCTTCKKTSPKCSQDRDTVPVELTVTKRPSSKSDLPEIASTATCWCQISADNLAGQKHVSGSLLDLTGQVNKTYSGLFPEKQANQDDCKELCNGQARILSDADLKSIESQLCSQNWPNGTNVTAYSVVGDGKYSSADAIGTLIRTPEVTKTTCICPKGWWANTTNVDGGVTADGKCKKPACRSITILPLPPNGTQLGSWGFSWGNELWAWGSKENGGAPKCVTTVISPAVCRLQK